MSDISDNLPKDQGQARPLIEDHQQARTLILFSGGLDSTSLVYRRLKEGLKVDLLLISAGQHEAKITAERQAAEAIVTEFEEMIKYGEVSGSIGRKWFDVRFLWNPHNGPNHGFAFCQVLPWLTTAFQAASPDFGYNHTAVEIAYCLGDQISLELYRIQEIWKLMWSVMRHDPFVPLEFPYKHTTKHEMMRILPKWVRDLTWTCELPKYEQEDDEDPESKAIYKACGRCISCVRAQIEEETFERVHRDFNYNEKPIFTRQEKDEERRRQEDELKALAAVAPVEYKRVEPSLHDIVSIAPEGDVSDAAVKQVAWSPRPYGMDMDVTPPRP